MSLIQGDAIIYEVIGEISSDIYEKVIPIIKSGNIVFLTMEEDKEDNHAIKEV